MPKRADYADAPDPYGGVQFRNPVISTEALQDGAVRKIFPEKGFGFLVRDDDPDRTEYFFHASVVKGGREAFLAMEVGDLVKFNACASTKGPRAVRVEPQ